MSDRFTYSATYGPDLQGSLSACVVKVIDGTAAMTES